MTGNDRGQAVGTSSVVPIGTASTGSWRTPREGKKKTDGLVSFDAKLRRAIATISLAAFTLFGGIGTSNGDDELARYAAQGNAVGVDGQCFIRKCAVETSQCANNPSCLKGLSCLAR
jgi:hypothetical protein